MTPSNGDPTLRRVEEQLVRRGGGSAAADYHVHCSLAGVRGRPRGSPNKIKADLSQMIINNAARAGFLKPDEEGKLVASGIDGCDGYLLWLAVNEPKTYAALLARILPIMSAHLNQLARVS